MTRQAQPNQPGSAIGNEGVRMDIIVNILVGFWQTFVAIAPYILLGFGMAGLLSVTMSQETIERHMGGRGFIPAIKAALLGIPLPLCSCGVLPVAASLRKHGASRGATVAFLLSTPQTGVDSIMATYGLLGPVIAIFRPVVAFFTGLIGGWLTDMFDRDDAEEHGAVGTHGEAACCEPKAKGNWLVRAMHHAFVTLPHDIGVPLVMGLMVSALISALVPPHFFSGRLGHGFGAMLIMMLASIPFYGCALASVPIAAAFIMNGVSPGAALVFMICGPATNAETIAVIWKVLGKRTTIVYLATTIVTALIAGDALDRLFVVNVARIGQTCCCEPSSSPLGLVSAILLLVIFGFAILQPVFRRFRRHSKTTSCCCKKNSTCETADAGRKL
jgi:uncharacterized membrane protein YraQ (UPF0718 family)